MDSDSFHLYRDMRTYGKYELLYLDALNNGSVFLKYSNDTPPVVEKAGERMRVKVRDQLTHGEEFEIEVDLVVLVTGMVPRKNEELADILKLPIGMDGFYNEIHPKLRPVETVIDGVFIAGASQGPKTLAESAASSLAAVSKSAALLMKGYVDLEPLIAARAVRRKRSKAPAPMMRSRKWQSRVARLLGSFRLCARAAEHVCRCVLRAQ